MTKDHICNEILDSTLCQKHRSVSLFGFNETKMFLCERVENVHDNMNDSNEEKPNIHEVRLFSIEVLINEEFNWNTQRPVDDIHY